MIGIIKENFETRKLDAVKVKGKKKPILIYELLSQKDRLSKKGIVSDIVLALQFSEVYQTPEEKINAVIHLKRNLEDDFVELGQLLSEIKRTKLFKYKGFTTFKEFVEEEFNISSSFANKLISTYEFFVVDLDIDEAQAKEIGLDKLNLIKSMLRDSSYEEKVEWIKKAEELPTAELREEIKEIRAEKREKNRTLKDIFVDQYVERMVNHFNCNRKELSFKLALYFQDANLEDMRSDIKEKQRKFEDGVL